MSGISFSRDEAILALDALYSAGGSRLNADSPDIVELSDLLGRLPIHSRNENASNFRTPSGILNQLRLFQRSLRQGKKHPDVGQSFFAVALSFEDDVGTIHEIANAIRINEPYFTSPFGSTSEGVFPEGALLGHLHCILERNETSKLLGTDHCEICKIKPSIQYRNGGELLQQHLLVPITKMSGKKKYGADCYITVCPTCHAALHTFRPWRTRENCEDILR